MKQPLCSIFDNYIHNIYKTVTSYCILRMFRYFIILPCTVFILGDNGVSYWAGLLLVADLASLFWLLSQQWGIDQSILVAKGLNQLSTILCCLQRWGPPSPWMISDSIIKYPNVQHTVLCHYCVVNLIYYFFHITLPNCIP